MRINWVGLVVFAAFCVALVMVVSRPAWMPLGEAAATILILLARWSSGSAHTSA